MSSIKAFECLTGHISGLCTLSGKLTCFGSLSGKLSAVIDFNAYSGEYEVVPNAFNTQVLPTANKVLKKDIVVQKVPLRQLHRPLRSRRFCLIQSITVCLR